LQSAALSYVYGPVNGGNVRKTMRNLQVFVRVSRTPHSSGCGDIVSSKIFASQLWLSIKPGMLTVICFYY